MKTAAGAAAAVACVALVPASRFLAAGLRLAWTAMGSSSSRSQAAETESAKKAAALQKARTTPSLVAAEVAAGAVAASALAFAGSERISWSLAALAVQVATCWELWFSRDEASNAGRGAALKLGIFMLIAASMHAIQLALAIEIGWVGNEKLMAAMVAAGGVLGFGLAVAFPVPRSGSEGQPARRFTDGGGGVVRTNGVRGSSATSAASNATDSALRENIQRKGEHSYYYAHAKTPTRENLNRGGDPVRLEDEALAQANRGQTTYRAIRDYAFADGSNVSVYVDLSKLDLEDDEVRHKVEHSEPWSPSSPRRLPRHVSSEPCPGAAARDPRKSSRSRSLALAAAAAASGRRAAPGGGVVAAAQRSACAAAQAAAAKREGERSEGASGERAASGAQASEKMAGHGEVLVSTASAPTNIAVVKYWGKRDTKLNLPINSSLSVTLHQEDLQTITSVAIGKDFEGGDRVWLNGKEETDLASNKRMQGVFSAIRERAGDVVDEASGEVLVPSAELKTYKIHVVSRNSFPTAAGLASSASGYACLVKALSQVFRVKEAHEGELTEIARAGSGSASRSLYGGYVKWEMGTRDDGVDSRAYQVKPEEHWPNMHALICVVSDHKKTTSSTGGMIDSVRTSELLKFRAENVVPARMKAMEEAIAAKDFPAFAELTMRDSNQFHATCLDTYPPIAYMTDTSHNVSRLVHAINNESSSGPICAYTFDAGPNAVIFLEEDHVEKVLKALLADFGPDSAESSEPFVRGQTTLPAADCMEAHPLSDANKHLRGNLKYIIHTRVGPGALEVTEEEKVLVDSATGLPK
ncbi:Diphosphomevalonate decarboxylase [Hondaea fermentalgiana]|uniref:diphosphomevalonate decarboxylase n=1 Tax=Hondaea fermentalgiana TaxID=2315210 RepID=A0A2R5G6Z3_9STRA|nr:Diphosphomevalonate decarboxylase [Hondaea fermentalgiana]|eukprot:GBG26760.1 Diphosphomevalonate decarboxylase [Hondaea fermentalgiana]